MPSKQGGPVDEPARCKDAYMQFGAKSMLDNAGFKEVARRKPHRPIVRLYATVEAVGHDEP
jgi:hypothetical protein